MSVSCTMQERSRGSSSFKVELSVSDGVPRFPLLHPWVRCICQSKLKLTSEILSGGQANSPNDALALNFNIFLSKLGQRLRKDYFCGQFESSSGDFFIISHILLYSPTLFLWFSTEQAPTSVKGRGRAKADCPFSHRTGKVVKFSNEWQNKSENCYKWIANILWLPVIYLSGPSM